jgi:hypothetical protein
MFSDLATFIAPFKEGIFFLTEKCIITWSNYLHIKKLLKMKRKATLQFHIIKEQEKARKATYS